LLVGLSAGYDLLFGAADAPRGRRAIPGLLARVWILVLLTTVGIDALLFGQNAVLQLTYLLALPLLPVQLGFLVSLLLASYFWIGG
jgi:hypothetical protein